ncbi:MAG TPA: MFS transporter [Candidatus Udaeobacter sp.]|nr:MFS transporter [Candidatus Udaeobacter sp.]
MALEIYTAAHPASILRRVTSRAPISADADHGATRWRMLALLALAELLGMSAWFAGNAIAPQLQILWHLRGPDVAWLNTAVQLGFVAGTAVAALLNLADLLPARPYFALSAAGAAFANAALLLAPGFPAAIAARFLTGFFLAGVYPPGMKMAATWFRRRRGLAIGVLVGALAIGKGLPYLVHALPGAGIRPVLLVTSLAVAAAAALVAATYRDGPFPFERRPFSWKLVGVVLHHRSTRLAIGGYLGHMWELYAMWVWLPAWIAAAFAAHAAHGTPSPGGHAVDLVSFGALVAGGAGCVWGGIAAARTSYERVVIQAMIASGICSLAVGLVFGAAPFWIAAIAWIWGFFVVADSAQFSALVTEVTPPHAVGTALTLQTSLGFLLTIASIQLVPVLVSAIGWRWAFAILALGPVSGIASIAALGRARPAEREAASPTVI